MSTRPRKGDVPDSLAALRFTISRMREPGVSDDGFRSLATGSGGRETVGRTAAQARKLGMVLTWALRSTGLPEVIPDLQLPSGRADRDAEDAMRRLGRLRVLSGVTMAEVFDYSHTTGARAAAIEGLGLHVQMRDLMRWAGWFGLHLAFVPADKIVAQEAMLDGHGAALAATFVARLAAETERLAAKKASRMPPIEIRQAILRLRVEMRSEGRAVPEQFDGRFPDTLEDLSMLLSPMGVRVAVNQKPGIAADVHAHPGIPSDMADRLAIGALRRISAEFVELRDGRGWTTATLAAQTGVSKIVCAAAAERVWGIDCNTLAKLVEAMGGGLELRRWTPDEMVDA